MSVLRQTCAYGPSGIVKSKYVDTGKVRYVFHNMPLNDLHPNAMKAARAAQCAADQGAFWAMHDRLFRAEAASLNDAGLLAEAGTIGPNTSRFVTYVSSAETAARVQTDLDDARRLGLTGTPAFLVGTAVSQGHVRVTYRIDGAQPLEIFSAVLDSLAAERSAN